MKLKVGDKVQLKFEPDEKLSNLERNLISTASEGDTKTLTKILTANYGIIYDFPSEYNSQDEYLVKIDWYNAEDELICGNHEINLYGYTSSKSTYLVEIEHYQIKYNINNILNNLEKLEEKLS